jgi:hypothetical protein
VKTTMMLREKLRYGKNPKDNETNSYELISKMDNPQPSPNGHYSRPKDAVQRPNVSGSEEFTKIPMKT